MIWSTALLYRFMNCFLSLPILCKLNNCKCFITSIFRSNSFCVGWNLNFLFSSHPPVSRTSSGASRVEFCSLFYLRWLFRAFPLSSNLLKAHQATNFYFPLLFCFYRSNITSKSIPARIVFSSFYFKHRIRNNSKVGSRNVTKRNVVWTLGAFNWSHLIHRLKQNRILKHTCVKSGSISRDSCEGSTELNCELDIWLLMVCMSLSVIFRT